MPWINSEYSENTQHIQHNSDFHLGKWKWNTHLWKWKFPPLKVKVSTCESEIFRLPHVKVEKKCTLKPLLPDRSSLQQLPMQNTLLSWFQRFSTNRVGCFLFWQIFGFSLFSVWFNNNWLCLAGLKHFWFLHSLGVFNRSRVKAMSGKWFFGSLRTKLQPVTTHVSYYMMAVTKK